MSDELARRFHEAYERLAPSFGYATRPETREFDPESPNGRLMIAVCAELSTQPAAPSPAVPKRATIADARDYLNTRDKAFWVTGWNECVESMLAAAPPAPASREQDSSHLAACAGGGATQPLTEAEVLLKRATRQIERWSEKYGEFQPQWLPPAGDVRLLEDIDAYLQATPVPESRVPLSEERILELARMCGDEDKHCFIFNKTGRHSVVAFAHALDMLRLFDSARGHELATGQMKKEVDHG